LVVPVPRRRRGGLDCAARDACAGRMGCLPCVVVDERGSKQGGPGGRRRKAGAGIVLADPGSKPVAVPDRRDDRPRR